MGKDRVTESPAGRKWTRPGDYVEALAFRRTARRSRRPKERTQPEAPRFILSTLPFLALLLALAALSVAIMVLAWPRSHPQPKPTQVAHERGYAPRGWLERAEKQMR
jgi:hypothetical protein